MTNRKIFLFLMVGLLAISFTLPARATARPAYALDPNSVPGWFLFSEGPSFNWNASLYGNNFSVSAWYQIWINNDTSFANKADAWADATAGMLLLVVNLGQPVDKFYIQVGIIRLGPFNLWNLVIPLMAWYNVSAEDKTIPGLTKALVWKSSTGNTWWGLGYSGSVVIFALGKGDQTPPHNPFEGTLGASKDSGPAASGASQTNIMALMAAQGSMLGGAIPGYTFVPIFVSIVVLLSIIYLVRKDQLAILKTK